jgi:hypothetical protein
MQMGVMRPPGADSTADEVSIMIIGDIYSTRAQAMLGPLFMHENNPGNVQMNIRGKNCVSPSRLGTARLRRLRNRHAKRKFFGISKVFYSFGSAVQLRTDSVKREQRLGNGSKYGDRGRKVVGNGDLIRKSSEKSSRLQEPEQREQMG